ncbi:unnamed protein product [Cyprideis torosa]|uniref:Uncharacterized protein n=1 Tax=Cyprideis torosa TaxID=163714 RepID=A0A7R8ZRW5_9CRUS|nr:unnamed protein product [Cyprideis torosa]CAG0900084.1 unnamed protein product [Cyprideis torosa]
MLIVTILTGLYYNMIIAWTVFYLFASFTSDLPWRTCSGDWAGESKNGRVSGDWAGQSRNEYVSSKWNTRKFDFIFLELENSPRTVSSAANGYCYSPDEAKDCLESSNGTQTFFNKTCVDIETLCSSTNNRCADPAYKGCPKKLMEYYNNTHCLNTTSELHGKPEYLYVKINRAVDYVLPAQEYFQNYMLRRSDSMEDYGTLQWPLVLCLLFAWLMVGGSLIKGVKSSGKVVYFTALFPYVVLVALLIKGAPLDGAFDGIVFYIQPNWETLLEPEVWVTATTQIFYSLSPAFGGLLTLSSYNRFDNNCQRDAILVAISNCATSVFAGFVIFSIVGHMAFLLDKPVGEVIQSGPGLAFIAYPQALAQMTVAPLWAIIFFVMLITLGLDSQFVMVETVTTAMFDEWPSLRMYKSKVVVAVCAVGWLLGLLFCTPGGIYLFNLIDSYAAGYSLLLIAIAEIILVTYVYGYVRFSEYIKQMIGPQNIFLRLYWSCTWHILAPVLLTQDVFDVSKVSSMSLVAKLCLTYSFLFQGILIFSLVDYTPAKYDDYVYPGWAQCLGWFMALISIAMIPIFAIYMYHKGRRMGLSLRDLVEPTPDWGPAHLRNTSRNNLVLQQHRPAQAHDN